MAKSTLKEMFPNWATQEAILKRIREEYGENISESDIYKNSSGDIVITLDFEHITIFPDEERPGLYEVCRTKVFSPTTTYMDANKGWEEFQT